MLNINAAKGFEYGSGFCGATMTGKEHNDLFNEDFTTKTNLSGGIQGGFPTEWTFISVSFLNQLQQFLDLKKV